MSTNSSSSKQGQDHVKKLTPYQEKVREFLSLSKKERRRLLQQTTNAVGEASFA